MIPRQGEQGGRHRARRIGYELGVLVHQPLVECWRAADMQIFGFGPQLPVITHRGKTVLNARYRLHVQCHWRMVDAERILFSRDDLFEPADPSVSRTDFNYDQTPSRLDVFQRQWFASLNEPPRVTAVEGDAHGGCRIVLTHNAVLECVPFLTGPDHEYWRFFDIVLPEGSRPHFVVSSDGNWTSGPQDDAR